jgi:hypothetical protein
LNLHPERAFPYLLPVVHVLYDKIMRALSITLFILGLFWAYASLGLVIAPITFFVGGPSFSGPLAVSLEFLLCICLSVNGLVGYWVWWGWLTRFRSGIFPRNYFRIAIIHHAVWLLIFPMLLASLLDVEVTINILKAWSSATLKMLLGSNFFPLSQVFIVWVVVNLVVCSACIFRNRPDT